MTKQATISEFQADHEVLNAEINAQIADDVTRYVVVEINNNMYGISTDATVELMDSASTQVTRVSHAPKYVQGVINHRGSIIPAIDTRSLLGFEARDENAIHSSMMIITEHGTQKVGLIVDAVHSVFDCPEASIVALPDSTDNSEFLRGLVHQPNGSYILIADIEHIYRQTAPE